MKNYKSFGRDFLGVSDVASLVLAGYTNEGFKTAELHFGCDGYYKAYIVDENDIEIGEHYKKVAEFKTWCRVYDDMEKTRTFRADRIVFYRAAEMGCIVHLIKE